MNPEQIEAVELTWSQIAKLFIVEVARQGPTIIVLILCLGGIVYAIVKWVAPWIAKKVEQALTEAEKSREQRKDELAADTREKAGLIASHEKMQSEMIASHERIESGHESKLGDLTKQITVLASSTQSLADQVGAQGHEQRRSTEAIIGLTTRVERVETTVEKAIGEDGKLSRSLAELAILAAQKAENG